MESQKTADDVKKDISQVTISLSIKFSNEGSARLFAEDLTVEQSIIGYTITQDGNQVLMKLATTEGRDAPTDLDSLFELLESALEREGKGTVLE